MIKELERFLREVKYSQVGSYVYFDDIVVKMNKKLYEWLNKENSPVRLYFGCFGGCGYGSLQVQELGDYVQLKIIPCNCHPYSYRLYIKFLQ